MLKHFRKEEFACKCGCGENGMKDSFLLKLDDLREEAGFPFIITSGFRCKKHNVEVSTTGEMGPHTTGRAVDIGIEGVRAYLLVGLAIKNGFTGIGIKQRGAGRFIHLDDLSLGIGQPRPRIWSY